jgi:hypothetical protein
MSFVSRAVLGYRSLILVGLSAAAPVKQPAPFELVLESVPFQGRMGS